MTTSRFVPRNVVRVDLADGDWVDLRTRLSYGDRAAVEERLLGLAADAQGRVQLGTDQKVHLREANIEMLVRAIAAWGGPGFCELDAHPHDADCRPRPITPENIAVLDETAERIIAELLRRIVTRTPDFTKPPSPPTPTAVTAEAPPSDSASSSSSSGSTGPGTNS